MKLLIICLYLIAVILSEIIGIMQTKNRNHDSSVLEEGSSESLEDTYRFENDPSIILYTLGDIRLHIITDKFNDIPMHLHDAPKTMLSSVNTTRNLEHEKI